MELKIGQVIEINNEMFTSKSISEEVVQLQAGTKILVTSKGNGLIISGSATGNLIALKDVELKGYDSEAISKQITRRLALYFPMEDMLQDFDVDRKDFEDVIFEILSEVL